MEQPEKPGALDLRTAKLEDLKGRDLTPGLVARAKKPKPTWFAQRGDGMVFACEEREAWDLLNNRSEWKRNDFKLIGYSDGKTYARITAEAMSGAVKLEPEIAKAKTELEKYRAAEERLIIQEAVDMDGEPEDKTNEENKQKVLRLRKIMEKLETKLETLEKQYSSFTADVVRRATDEERKVAVKNWKKESTRRWPGAVNIHTPGVDVRERRRILGAMSQGGRG